MAILRNVLLAGSQSRWLRERATRYGFVRRAVSRFMPGEEPEDALAAACELQKLRISTVFTRLGENITDERESIRVADYYLDLLQRIRELALTGELSIKLTQLGLDLSPALCYENLRRIVDGAGPGRVVWIDMEASNYVDLTLDLYRRARAAFSNVGVCLQAYLYRTQADLQSLLPLGPAIRLVKGAYRESPDRAFPRKSDVDENFFALTKKLFGEEARRAGARAAIGTHDLRLIRRTEEYARTIGLSRDSYEFQMLYGIQRQEQLRLARDGYTPKVLISYGNYWFPWYMRRLAERPANVLFVLRTLLSG
jgi:proline dehydrogenase